ncbi:hypothetical protein AB5I41_08890 [Sphingomonas sp. MMS24-JH45]
MPVADDELAGHRGGFRVPGHRRGHDDRHADRGRWRLAVLRTVFRADQGTPTLVTYAPRTGETVAAAPAGTARPNAALPTISYDRQSGIQVTGGVVRPALSLAARPARSPRVWSK